MVHRTGLWMSRSRALKRSHSRSGTPASCPTDPVVQGMPHCGMTDAAHEDDTVTNFERLLAKRGRLLADGATGTNFFDRGLTAGDPPEIWCETHPDIVQGLHREFIEAGCDIILTDSFGGSRFRLALHGLDGRARELNRIAATLARETADKAGRPVIVAGCVGPTGELFEPLGALRMESAVDAFLDQMEGLKEGGADLVWIETMSAIEELQAAARAATLAGMPYVATASFDTAGRTMMGLAPADLPTVFAGLEQRPLAVGANCGVGASDLLVSLLSMVEADPGGVYIAKANSGIPQVKGEHVHYSGTPELMADYVHLALDAGARIVGGCCGTTAKHLAAMRAAMDNHRPGAPPDLEAIVARTGALASPPATRSSGERPRRRRARA